MQEFGLVIRDKSEQEHKVSYRLTDGSIPMMWMRKLKKIYRVPLDDDYTRYAGRLSEQQLVESIVDSFNQLNSMIHLGNRQITDVTLDDCNWLHDLAVQKQNSYSYEIREIFHHMHKNIHLLEEIRGYYESPFLEVGWGEREGLMKGIFKEDPYQHYVPIVRGNLYLTWSEFGKTPYIYWKNKDDDDRDKFFRTCKPHRTFRMHFSLCIKDHDQKTLEPEFYEWFEKYRDEWMQRYGIDWTEFHQLNSILLATPISSMDFSSAVNVSGIWLGNLDSNQD